jgi:ribosomal protein S18 acetylase RimI-like enzyme
MSLINFRVATQEDAAEIANVHINSWRESYAGLMPQEFLDDRPLYFRNRFRLWKKVTVDPTNRTYVAECPLNGVIGFINGSAARDKEYAEYAEVYCIYLLKKYQRKNIGSELLKMYFEEMKNKGFKKVYLWVLKDNPSIIFYEISGGKHNGHVKEAEIAGVKMQELCYVWEDLSKYK